MYNNYNEISAETELNSFNLRNYFLQEAELNSNIESIFQLFEKTQEAETEIDFFYLILTEAFKLIPEAEYGQIVINYQDPAYFLKKVYRQELLSFDIASFQKNYSSFYFGDIIFKSQRLNKKLIINFKLDNQFLGAAILYIPAKKYKGFSNQSVKIGAFLEKIASSYLISKRYQRLQEKLKQEIILSLSNLLAIHDQYTKGHNQKVAELSRELAELTGLNKNQIQQAYWTGILHDIGKTLIPASILNKKAPLTKKEFSEIKKHPEWAYQTLKDSAELKDIASYVLYHHEKWDGSGYPDQLAGNEIPIISQIVSIADAWDAMTSNRSYRKALSHKEAIKRLKNNRGKQFSPLLLDVFLDNIS
ncbi:MULTISPECIES: HD-GYP domain-containing protein [Halanaerobium]|uniref:HD domain-containing protein n=1 Tax=Halanaerobium kushneri TaxID=56779 RepID=A0A1N6YE55_9FIRM|nr:MULTISPECIES: HD-GYP domain-containing protein [Halanaerobium]RCW50603.1 HD domain-containing protein [Halanaerobium sp. ST460_2HS_T2]SIR12864.1 HD domain-containing protein [Halanaerobium kushneri]